MLGVCSAGEFLAAKQLTKSSCACDPLTSLSEGRGADGYGGGRVTGWINTCGGTQQDGMCIRVSFVRKELLFPPKTAHDKEHHARGSRRTESLTDTKIDVSLLCVYRVIFFEIIPLRFSPPPPSGEEKKKKPERQGGRREKGRKGRKGKETPDARDPNNGARVFLRTEAQPPTGRSARRSSFLFFFGPHEAGKQQTRARGGCAAQPALGAPGGGAEGARSRSVTVATAPTAAAAATAEEKRGNTRSPRCGSLPWQRLSPATASAPAATVLVSPPPTQSGASKPGRGLLLFALLPRERDLPAAARLNRRSPRPPPALFCHGCCFWRFRGSPGHP